MKALSVLQPWAQLIILGAKRYEIRRWQTRHRGPLLIHAGHGFPEKARALCNSQPYRDALALGGCKSPSDLPRGVILGGVTLEECLPTDQLLFNNPDAWSLALEKFRSGYWAWKMSNPQRLPVPIPYQGVLGIFEVDQQEHSQMSPKKA